MEKGIVSGLLLDLGGVCIIGGKDFLNARRGQLAATALGLVPRPVLKDSLLKFFPERNISSGFTDRCSHHFVNIGLSVLIWRGPRGPGVQSTATAAVIFFQDGAGGHAGGWRRREVLSEEAAL